MLYDVRLDGFDGDEIVIIDLCMSVCGYDASTAYMIVDNMPSIIAHNVDINEANKIKKIFEGERAFIEITSPLEESSVPKKAETVKIESTDDEETYNEFDFDEEINLDVEKEVEQDTNEEDGINLEQVFEDHTSMNMKPNDYGDYALDKLESSEDNNKDNNIDLNINDINTNDINTNRDNNVFTDSFQKFEFIDEKPAYSNIESISKQYISKNDIGKTNPFSENAKPSYNNLSSTMMNNMNMGDVNNNSSNKQYISKEYLENKEKYSQAMQELSGNEKQEIVSNDNNGFLNLGTPYNKDCMQIKTQRNDNDGMESSEDKMKNLYDKKATKTIDDPEVANSEWFKIIKKNISDNNNAQNTNDYQKEQMVCPKCGSSFVSSKKSQGFFGTKKIKYVCEACKYKF